MTLRFANRRLTRSRRAWIPAVILAVSFSSLPALAPTAASAAVPTDAPVIQSPLPGETVNSNPVLQWEPVAGAVKYRLHISTSSSFSSLLQSQVDTTNTKATISADLPLGTVYWRVAATDGGTGVGPFETSSFERVWSQVPQLTAPADGAVLTYPDDAVSFAWEPLPGASKYQVQVDDNSSFTTPEVDGTTKPSDTTTNPAFTLREPQTVDQPFFWRVRAVAKNNTNTDWSDTWSYTIVWPDVPQLTAPADQTHTPITDVVLDWDPVDGAATYQLQISPNGDWANNVAVDVAVKGTRYSRPITLNNGDYYWRVRARDAKTPLPNLGGWSEERQFMRGWPDRPQLIAPADDSVMTMNPTFEWEPVPHASHYLLEISPDVNFDQFVQTCITTHTSYTPYKLGFPTPATAKEAGSCPLEVDIGDRYYWRVRGLDGPLSLTSPPPVLGLWSNFGASDTFSFVFEAPVPVPTAPADGASVHTPTLKWNPVAGQGRYRVIINPLTGGSPVSVLTYATSYTPTQRLAPGNYEWYVLSESPTSGQGINVESMHRTFTLIEPNNAGSVPTPVTPAHGATSTRMPSLTWTPVSGAHYYRVYVSPDSGIFHELHENTQLPFAGFTDTAIPLPPGTYQWFVRAFAEDNTRIADGSAGEFVIASLDHATYTGPCDDGVSCVVGDTPTLRWEHTPDAGSYIVYLAVDPNFTNVKRIYHTEFNELRPREALLDSQAGESYYWFVRPCITPLPAQGCGPFNSEVHPNAFLFRKRSAAAQQVTPAADATVANEPTFSWTEYLDTTGAQTPVITQGARKYHVQVSTANTFATILDEDYVDQKTYTPSAKTYPEGQLFWRVQALDGSGNPLTYSATRKLTKSSPPVQPIAPVSGTTVDRMPTFRWESLPFAARYEVEVYKNADTLYSSTNRVAFAAGGTATKLTGWTPQNSLPSGTYAWRVRRLDVDNWPGVWSGGGTFTLAPPTPELATPADDAMIYDDDLEFTWSVSNAAVQYRFQSSTSPTFSSLFENVLTSSNAWAPSKHYPDGTYYWRVQVLNSASAVVATSGVRSFTKQTPMTTQLSLAVSTTTVIDPGTVTLKGTLVRKETGARLSNRSVEVMGRYATSSTYRKLATVTTDSQGGITWKHAPRRYWVYKLRFPTNGVVVGSSSSGRTVKYKPVMRTAMAKSDVRRGDRALLKGTISPYFKGRRVILQKRTTSGSWKSITSRELGRPANTRPRVTKFAFRLSTRRSGYYYYRAKFPGKRNVNLEVVGPGLRLRVV